MSLLEVNGLNTYYGDSHILFDISLRVERNEVIALLGRNGAGKSTTLKSLMGVVRPHAGTVRFRQEIAGKRSHTIARAGMQLVHEERRIFGSLNVEENLMLAGLTAQNKWPLERIYDVFPRLKQRRGSRGTDLSGGEQQMLAIARALIRDPQAHPPRRAVRRLGTCHRARLDDGLPQAGRGWTDNRACRTEPRGHAGAGPPGLHHQQWTHRA